MGRKGLQDDEILTLLPHLRRPTFFTRDLDFYKRHLCHARYCLVRLVVEQEDVATFVRKVLRHPALNTEAKRLGSVMRVSTDGVRIWRLNTAQDYEFDWNE